MKVWTSTPGNSESFILFTDIKEDCSEILYDIVKLDKTRPEVIKIYIESIELNLNYKKTTNILKHYSAELDWINTATTSIYKFGPYCKKIFHDKNFWCKLARYYDEFHSRS